MAVNPNSERRPADIWGDLVIGLLLIAAAAYFYVDLTELETSGGERSMPSIFAGLYNGLGKWGVVTPFALAGAAFLWSFKRKRAS